MTALHEMSSAERARRHEREELATIMAEAWLPMALAPKGSSSECGRVETEYLLVFVPLDREMGFDAADDAQIGVGVGWWEPNLNGGNGCWYNGSYPIAPTHWMPLPKAPAPAPPEPLWLPSAVPAADRG